MATQQVSEVVTKEQAEGFWESGYLHVPAVFTEDETDALADGLETLMGRWAFDSEWTGPWREMLLDPELAKTSRFRALHDLQLYSAAWSMAIRNERLVAVLTALLGEDVEFHHTTMHVKPAESGQPFPMHQDWPFYPHADSRYVDVLVHLDDTSHENGEIRFLPGSHKGGPLQHVTVADRTACTPHLRQDEYRLAETVAVPAKRGDIVCFNINTVHGSYLNSTRSPRRLVRMGYRNAGNAQLSGQAFGRPGIMVAGSRPRGANQQPFSENT